MKRLLLVLLFCLPTLVYATYTVTITSPYAWPVVKVIDGDSIVVEAKWLPPELGDTISIRIGGVDTPERGWRADCDKEREMSEEVTAFVTAVLLDGRHTVVIQSWDKFGGRVIGDFVVGDATLSQMLLDKGYAKPYNGTGPKPKWCD